VDVWGKNNQAWVRDNPEKEISSDAAKEISSAVKETPKTFGRSLRISGMLPFWPGAVWLGARIGEMISFWNIPVKVINQERGRII